MRLFFRSAGLSSLLLVSATAAIAQTQVPFERIRRADQDPGNWLTYSGNYSSHRHTKRPAHRRCPKDQTIRIR
ncbi:MAG: hypothetical protein EBS05_27230, partial [Proteobacteria bacterium]|nr:hypothetical protein [Pseudomonadota bacterium]